MLGSVSNLQKWELKGSVKGLTALLLALKCWSTMCSSALRWQASADLVLSLMAVCLYVTSLLLHKGTIRCVRKDTKVKSEHGLTDYKTESSLCESHDCLWEGGSLTWIWGTEAGTREVTDRAGTGNRDGCLEDLHLLNFSSWRKM